MISLDYQELIENVAKTIRYLSEGKAEFNQSRLFDPPTQDKSPMPKTHSINSESRECCQELALQALAESSVAELRFLRVDECESTIRLTGDVRSFYHKQLAQETVRPMAGARRVINQVRVSAD